MGELTSEWHKLDVGIITGCTISVTLCRWILKGLENLIQHGLLVLTKGKVTDRFQLNIERALIPSISEQPVKSLGKVFDSSLKDFASVQSTCQEPDNWLRSIDRTGLLGKFKA